jgi:hypothetical protein
VSLHFLESRVSRRGEGSVYCDQQTRAIEDTPAVQWQSSSADPGIATAPRSVVQVLMTDGESTGFREVSAPATPAVQVPEEEEEKNEDTESGNSDDDEDMDDINHTALPKEVVRPNSPTVRPQTVDIWNHVNRIANCQARRV